ncbi:MAG: TetR/AcrR family transcriptional regulator [Acidimicrobiales bacterium]|nr:TetR/AcrR family transcriptional regulator [Acidimicrobiales bacterium]
MSGATPRKVMLDAVVDHALEFGIADQSLRTIAEAVGTSHRMLIHHFGSKEGLFVEVIREVEQRQRVVLAGLQADPGGDPFEIGLRFWNHLCDPFLAPQERLFFEVYGQALQGRSWAVPLLDGVVDEWIGHLGTWLADARGQSEASARVDARLMLAVTRGLLLDLLATGDRAGVDAAMARCAELLSAATDAPAEARR